MKKLFSILVLATILLQTISCKKKKDNIDEEADTTTQPTNTPPLNVKAYLPLKIGNYWIYQTNNVDTNGNVLNTEIDSVYVDDTTRSRR